MKILFLAFLSFTITLPLRAQDNCFAKASENFEKSTLPFPLKADAMFKELVGCRAPAFNVKTIDGQSINLENLKGKIVVINFWFTTCAPCLAELPALNKLADEFKSQNVVFIAFAKNDNATISKFIAGKAFNYLQVSSAYDLSEEFSVCGWPTNLVLDKNGIVRQIFAGGRTDEKAQTEAYEKMRPVILEWLAK